MFNQVPQKIVQTNRLPFFIGVIVLILVMALFMYKAQTNQQSKVIEQKPRQSLYVSSKGLESNWFNEEKFKNIKIITEEGLKHKPTVKDIEAQYLSKEDVSVQLDIDKLIEKNKIQEKQLELEAMKAPLSIDVPPPPGSKTVIEKGGSNKSNISDEIDQAINMVKSAAGGDKFSTLAGLAGQLAADLNNQDSKKVFLNKNPTDDDYLENSKQKPRSPYEVKAGTYIPAALITGINSDLPGNVNAQVTENVYDTVTGNYLLIPQGTRLIGEYNSSLSFGQQRVQVVWNRIIFPDGKSLDLDKMQGVDISGYTGFHDKVDNHYLRIYGSAILLSLMGAGYDILNQDTQQTQGYANPRDIVAANVGQKLSDVSNQSLQKNMDVQPTLIIQPGYKFKVFVMKDMVLEKLDDVEGTLTYSE